MRKNRRIILFFPVTFLVIAVIGFVVETILQGNEEIPAPRGLLVKVHEQRVHLYCTGQGSPTVVLESGLGGSSLDWGLVQERLAKTVRVCSYDRAGYGWSDPSPLPRSPLQITEDLRALLHTAGEPGPYLLVGHSIGGIYAHLYASLYPKEVAGLVLVDPRNKYYDLVRSSGEQWWSETLTALMLRGTEISGRLGLVRPFGSKFMAVQSFPTDQQQLIVRLAYKPETIDTALRELAGARDLVYTRQVIDTLNEIRVTILTAGVATADQARWLESHQRMASLSSNGKLVIAANSGHYIHWQEPELVVDNILACSR